MQLSLFLETVPVVLEILPRIAIMLFDLLQFIIMGIYMITNLEPQVTIIFDNVYIQYKTLSIFA